MFSSNLNCNFIREFNPDLRSHTFTSHLRDILVSKVDPTAHALIKRSPMLLSCLFVNRRVMSI